MHATQASNVHEVKLSPSYGPLHIILALNDPFGEPKARLEAHLRKYPNAFDSLAKTVAWLFCLE